jgi:predicted PurR-regulated permease PerM
MDFVQRHMTAMLAAACGILLVAAAYLLGSIFVPLLVALILAYLLDPLVEKLVRRRVNRSLAICIIFLVVVSGFALVMAFLYLRLRSELADVQINLPAYANRLYEAIPQEIKVRLDIETPDKVYRHANMLLGELRSGALGIVREAFGLLTKAFASTLGLVLAVVGYLITPIYLFYLLKDLTDIRERIFSLVPPRYHEPLALKLREIDDVLSAFVRGQLLVCVFLAIMYSLGFIVIGIDLGVFIGVLSGFAFIIPYVGTFLAIVLSLVMAALKYHDLFHPVLCIGWVCLVQALEGGIVTPRIVGDKVGIHPIIALLALLIGGQLFGILGMLLAIPAAAVVKVLLVSVLDRYHRSAYFGGV